MGNWWADKLGVPQRQAPAPLPGPGGAPVTPMVGQPTVMTPSGPQPLGEGPPLSTDGAGMHFRLWEWGGNPRGGALETQRTGNCPACGSARYFSKSSGAVTTQNGIVMPRPECMECGYPQEQGAWGAATISGQAQAARGDEAPAPPGSLGHLRQG